MPRLCGQKGKLLGLLNALSHTRTHPPPAILYSLYMYLQATHVVSLPTSYIYIYIRPLGMMNMGWGAPG